MRDRLQGLLVVIVVALSGFTLTGPASGPRNAGDASGSDPSKGEEPKAKPGPMPKAADKPDPARASPNGYPWKPLDDFWAGGPEPDFSSALAAKADRMDLEFLIATVPDPLDSRFGYRFDGVIDDIQMAIESHSWSLDHFWLPWQPSGKQPSRNDDLGPVEDPEEAKQSKKLHEREPGVMLFRQARNPDDVDRRRKLLILFLVGETPTWGVHKIALMKCFDIIGAYQKLKGSTGQPSGIRIVGPYFTGTQPSLSLAIADWAGREVCSGAKAPKFRIRSGSASKINREVLMQDAAPAEVEFDATVIHFDNVLNQTLAFLKERNGNAPLGKVALLTESDTAFGNTHIKEPLSDKMGIVDLVQMKFPFHISQVAVAYDKNRSAVDKNLPVLARSSNKLRIPFDETGSPRDVMPSLSPAMGAATDEFVLSKMLDTISGEDFRYVGIVASDTRDVLFLAGLIREFCPDVQLFTTAGDLLLAHPAYAHYLRGTVVASSYPMFSIAQRWDPPYAGDRRRHLFSHEIDEGCYNATLSLLFKDDPTGFYDESFDYGEPFDEMVDLPLFPDLASKFVKASDSSRYRPSADTCKEGERPRASHRGRPPLWIGVVGQRGLWPLETRDYLDRHEYVFVSSYQSPCVPFEKLLEQFIPIIPQYHWIWGTMFLGLSALIWAVFLAHGRVVRAYLDGTDGGDLGPPPSSEHRWLLVELMRRRGPLLRSQQETYFLSAVAILAIAYGYCVILPCRITLFKSPWHVFLYPQTWQLASWGDKANWLFSLCVLVIATATSVALVAILAGRVRLYWSPAFDRVLPAWSFGALAAVVVSAVVVVVAFWPIASSPPYHDLLFFERAVNLGNGVSPLTPGLVMTLVCALWLACQQRRLALVERLWINGPFDGDTRPPLDRLARSESKIHDLLTIWFPRIFAHPACLIGLGLVGIAILRLLQRYIPTVDGHRYSFLMILAFCLLSCIVLLAFFRFVFLWRSLRTLLRDLTLLPMVKSYDRLPAVIALSFGRYLDDLHPKLSNLTLAVRQWAIVARDFEEAQIEMAEAYFGRPLGQLDADQRARLDRLATAIELDPDLSGSEAAQQIRKHFESECALGDHVTFSRSDTRSGIRNAAAACLAILPSLWDRGSLEEGYGEPPKDAAAAGGPSTKGSPLLRWRREAEDLVALEFILFVGQCSVHLRNLATFLAIGPILMAIAIASYPFQPERFLMVFAWSIAFCVAIGVIWVFVEMEHNEFLSRVSKTEPGKMTFDRTFVTSTLTYIIPLLGILIAQFPQVSDLLNQWFEPVLRVLK